MDARMRKNRMMRWIGRPLVTFSLVLSCGVQAAGDSVPAQWSWCTWAIILQDGFDAPPNLCFSSLDGAAKASAITYIRAGWELNSYSYTDCVENNNWGTCIEEHTYAACWDVNCMTAGPNPICDCTNTGPWFSFNPRTITKYAKISCPIPTVNSAVPYKYNAISNMCERSSLAIILSSGNEVEPSKGSTIKSLPFIANVVDQNTNQPPDHPVKVRISLKVDPTSGGHEHGDSTRPRGRIENKECASDAECWSGMTDPSGNVVFNFKSPEAAGIHTITATCDGCTNNPQAKDVNVKVEGLDPIPASEFYTFIGGGTNKAHHDNHYLTPAASGRLLVIAINYQSQDRFKVLDWRTNAMVYPPVLHVNDASLKWGGRFDIKADWTNPHITHMRGIEVDIRANEAEGAIPPENFEEFDKLLDQSISSKNARRKKFLRECSANAISTAENPNPIQHNRKPENYCVSEVDGSFDNNRHYHVRLLGD